MDYDLFIIDEHRNQIIMESAVINITGIKAILKGLGSLTDDEAKGFVEKLVRTGQQQVLGRNTKRGHYRIAATKLELNDE